jgi:hypothetical protein
LLGVTELTDLPNHHKPAQPCLHQLSSISDKQGYWGRRLLLGPAPFELWGEVPAALVPPRVAGALTDLPETPAPAHSSCRLRCCSRCEESSKTGIHSLKTVTPRPEGAW